jgi:hypothetical protein
MKRPRKRHLKPGQSPAKRWKAPMLKNSGTMDPGLLKELGYQQRAKSLATDYAELERIYHLFGIDLVHGPMTTEDKEQEDYNWVEIILHPDKGSLAEMANLNRKLNEWMNGIPFEHHIVMPDGSKMHFHTHGKECFFTRVIVPGRCIQRSIPYNNRETAKSTYLGKRISWIKTFSIVR